MPPHKKNGVSSSTGKSTKVKRVNNACQTCRKKKIKCNGENPCISCINYNVECYYTTKANNKPPGSNIDFSKARALKKKALELAQKLTNYEESERQPESFETISKQIDSLNNILGHRAKPNTPEEEVIKYSRETKYHSQCRKGKFWEFMNGERVVDPIFGLHNTISIFSIGGRNWILSRLQNFEKEYDIKDKFYQDKFIQIFNNSALAANKVMGNDVALWSETLSSNEWFQIIHTELDFNAIKQIVISMNDNELAIRHFTTKEKLLQIVERLSSDIELIDLEYFPLICLLLKFKKQHINNPKDTLPKIKVSRLIKFGIRLFQRLMFSFEGGYNSLKGLVQLMEYLESPYIASFPSTILKCALDFAKKDGLHSMEYYVGHTEADSNERRKVFWKLFVMDKWNYLADGRDIRIVHSQVSTFLPSKIHNVMVKFDSNIFNYETLTNYLSYYEIEISKIVSKMYLKVFNTGDYEYSKPYVLEILAELEKLQLAIIPQFRPGSSIELLDDYKINESERQKLHMKALHLHLFYYLTLNFLLRNTLDALDNVYQNRVLNNDLKIFEIFFAFGTLSESYKLSYVKFTMSSACYLIYSYIKNPYDANFANKLLEFILKYSSIIYSYSIKNGDYDHWEMVNSMLNSMILPCVDIFELIKSQRVKDSDTNFDLINEIQNFRHQVKQFEELMNKESDQHQALMEQILSVNMSDVDSFFRSDNLNNESFYDFLI
ncbi:putative transcriptional regulatory protein [Wickerhamomyces ciferrii]|uniref:Transcriptional regulatory protein n=1 Tax=Wickerhamomyces ciferrii (strain ATCC 14091 / BCRC 22168 / CBS 111 / JCM 3599 / NBRC 0793 / NRRL Y-1031 F-60-10) TaxID=1206466 RepID=K0KRC6_WICCF|nr:putative transcriptional regulatory protein [Wickerhamomyces ciferrii]CCH44627.1 putative transcriptional regulatory protein [Wickerhamomyces ciferrii]